MRPETPEARRTLNPTSKNPTAMRVTECKPIPKDMFLSRRNQYAQSAPDLRTESLSRLNIEQRPEAAVHQLQTESANYAHCKTANTYAMSLSTTDLGERHKLQQSRPSLQRAEYYNFPMNARPIFSQCFVDLYFYFSIT